MPQTVVTAEGSTVQAIRRDVAERVAESYGVAVDPVLPRTRLGFLEARPAGRTTS